MTGLGESAFPIRLADEGTEVGKALLDAFFESSLELGDDLAGRKNHIAENGYLYLDMADIS